MLSGCRRRHEQAAMFGSEQREAAAQQLNLQPASDKSSLGEADQDRPASIDIGRNSSAAIAAKADRDRHEREAVSSAKQHAAQKQSVPGSASLKQPGGQQRAQTHSSMVAQQQGSGRPELGVPAGRSGTDVPGAPKASNYGAQQKEKSSTKPAAAAGTTYNLM